MPAISKLAIICWISGEDVETAVIRLIGSKVQPLLQLPKLAIATAVLLINP